ncbi:MAG TPA: DUF4062 domain-containing protein [Bryobacteraceae bacterium]|jgi:hypothetical protein|nr:DUF4062 domain-containing protein [Bryobacteraceae bacterium]
MQKRYQVFVSSTYEDLHEERREVMQALLALNCIPTGMELFPAADDDSWTHISCAKMTNTVLASMPSGANWSRQCLSSGSLIVAEILHQYY